MFGEQMNNKKIEPVNLPKSAPIKEEIYVMPEKFHNQPVDNSNKVLFLVLIILVVALLGSGIYFAIDIMKKNSTKVIPVAINQPVKIEEPITETPKPVVPVNSPATTTEVVATSTSTVATSTIEVAPPVVSPSTPPILAMDSDVDNLTDIEEGIISADPNNPDTDGDTYKDGDELINGYNPLLAGSSDSAKLSSAVFMNGFTTNFVTDNFRVLYFHNWQVNAIAATKQLFITTNTGEIIKVSIKDNPTLLSIFLLDLEIPHIRQYQLFENYVVDFYCPRLRLVIEVD
ncbi:MAG: hypothetical protein WCL61_03625, partial [bacterium]